MYVFFFPTISTRVCVVVWADAIQFYSCATWSSTLFVYIPITLLLVDTVVLARVGCDDDDDLS